VGPSWSGQVQKILPPPGFDPWTVQPLVSHYTDYAIPAQIDFIDYRFILWLRWSRGSMLAFSTQVCGFKPGQSHWIFRAKKSSARLPLEGK